MTKTESKTIKGEQTKNLIIKTTLDIIVESGLAAVSYRSIAKKANIRHSLTTYHFGSIDNLICLAFDRFEEDEWNNYEPLTQKTLKTFNKLKGNVTNEDIINELTEGLTEYTISSQSGERQRQSTIESQFIFSLNVSDDLSKRIRNYNNRVLASIEAMLAEMGSLTPEIHSNMLLSSVRYFELANATGHIGLADDLLKKTLNQQVRAIFNAP